MESTTQLKETVVGRLGDYFQHLAGFRGALVEHFNASELKDLCFELGIDYESLSGDNKTDKARELIAYCLRRGKLAELLQKCAAARPGMFDQFIPLPGDSSPSDRPADQAAVYDLVARRLQSEPYAYETLSRWSLQPDSAGARATLAELLDQALRDDPAFAELLRAVLAVAGQKPGDHITQTVTTGPQSQTGNITLTGKIESH
jgi:hypothetical protein